MAKSLAAMLVATFVLAAGAAATNVPVLKAGQVVRLSGTNVSCEALSSGGTTYVSCRLAQFSMDGTYTFVLDDDHVVVAKIAGGKTTTVFDKSQPTLHLGMVFPSGKGSGAMTVKTGEEAAIGGTHVTIGAADIAMNEPALLAGIPTAKGTPVSGSYVAAISAKEVVISHWKGTKATVVFEKKQA